MAYQIRQNMCSCCHRCRVLCPMDAIRFVGSKYQIDPEKCIECGVCARQCHNCAIYLKGEAIETRAPHAPKERTCDVVICGGGGSGLLAAVRLAKAGKRTIVLEKNRYPGGNTWYASGFHSHYSRLQKEAGVPDHRERDLQQFIADTDNLLDPVLAKNVYYASEKMMDFLIDECDCQEDFYLGDTPFGGKGVMFENKSGTKFKRIDASIGPGGMGSFVVEKLIMQCKALDIPILSGHEAKEVLLDEHGNICGVRADDGGGDVIVHAKAVIMATGSYSHNPAYLAKANPEIPKCKEPIHLFSVPTCTGDGITMCQAIGADIDWENAKAMILGPAHHPFGFAGVCICREPEVVLVNKEGKRWASEVNNTMGLRDVILEQPDREAWAILDQHMLDTLGRRLSRPRSPGDEHAAIIQNYQQEADAEAKMDKPLKKADTLEELAGLMGVPADSLVATIRRYNEFCRNRQDEDFGKDARFLMPLEKGPYYAYYEKLFQENAAGGMKIDSETRVKNTVGEAIPGLYAVGDNCSGLMLGSGKYAEYVEMRVSMLTWALTSGYMVADTVLHDLSGS